MGFHPPTPPTKGLSPFETYFIYIYFITGGNKMIKRTILLISIMFILLGVVSFCTPKYKRASQNNSNQSSSDTGVVTINTNTGEVTIYFIAIEKNFKLSLNFDGKKLFNEYLGGDEYAIIKTVPGKHKLIQEHGLDILLEIETKPNHSYYIVFDHGLARPFYICDINECKSAIKNMVLKFTYNDPLLINYKVKNMKLLDAIKYYCEKANENEMKKLEERFLNKEKPAELKKHFLKIASGDYPLGVKKKAKNFLKENFDDVTITNTTKVVSTNNSNSNAGTPITQSAGSPKYIPPRAMHALIVGVGKYESTSFPSLPYAERDARAMYNMLINKKIIGIPSSNVKLIVGKNATSKNINVAIGKLLKKASSKNNLVLFYFSGHGAPLTKNTGEIKDGLLVPYDGDIDSLEYTCIPLSTINSRFNRTSSNAIVMLDACFSGQGKSAGVLPPGVKGVTISKRKKLVNNTKTNKVLMTGSGADQFSNDYDKSKHGLFTHFVLEGIGNKRADGNYDGICRDG